MTDDLMRATIDESAPFQARQAALAGDLERAQSLLNQYLAKHHRSLPASVVSELCYTLGVIRFMHGDDLGAYNAFNGARNTGGCDRQLELVINHELRLIEARSRTRNLPGALEQLIKARRLQVVNHPAVAGAIAGMMGWVHVQLDDPVQAGAWFKTATEEVKGQDGPIGFAVQLRWDLSRTALGD